MVFARFHAGDLAAPLTPAIANDAVPGFPDDGGSPVFVGQAASAGILTATEPPTENLWALPAAFGLALLIDMSGFGRVIIFSSASNWAHELGHATWRWMNGRNAVPLLFFTVYFDAARSFVTSLFVVGGLATLFVWARGEDCRALQALAVGFFVIFLGFAAFMPPSTEHFLESFAGIFGEFWIGTLWVVLFYYRFPAVVHWESLRYAFLFLGALSLTRITGVFLASRHDMSLLPWGSFFGGDGDLDHLLDGGWLVPTIRRIYVTIAALCFSVTAFHYVWFARAALREMRK